MDATHQALWTKLKAFQLDDPASPLPFSIRLARENGWSLRYAQRALTEYKRFAFLTTATGHAVCPSEAVDAVWHLHLCYTRSYWHDLCRDTLGQPLHHEPTRGGADQLEHHRSMYDRTLAAYRHFFGESPPEDLWPPTVERFVNGGRERHVNTAEHWIVRKPSWPRCLRSRLLGRSLSGAGAIVMIPTLGIVWNPLEMRGPEFLKFYLMFLVLAAVGAYVLRRLLLADTTGEPTPDLHPLEVAVLAGSEQQAMYVALAQLTHLGYVEFRTTDGITMYAAKPLNKKVHPLTEAIYQAVESSGEATLSTAWNAGRPKAAQIAAKLEKAGLLASSAAGFVARWLPALVVGSVFLLGLIKIGIGIDRNKPVGILVLLSCVTVAVIVCFARKPWRNQQGDRLLRELQRKNSKISNASQLPESESQLLMQWCLYGLSTMLLTGGTVTALHNWIQPRNTSSGGGCTAGCGSGCGGGGGGCGGCGGD